MSSVNHKDRAHALLSASSSSRWINCPPSARMEDKFEDSGDSIFAAEGTLAHEMADALLRIAVGQGDALELKKKLESVKSDELYQSDMDEYVNIYVNYVLEQFYAASKKCKFVKLKIEERTDYSYLVPEGFGTSDANIISDGTLEIVDLKYGKGVRVDSTGNSQLRLYALGLLRAYDLAYDIDKVKMTIVQPRLWHIDSETMYISELHDWADGVVKPAAELAHRGEGNCKTGSWCRWCKAKAVCRTLAEKNLELAKLEFASPNELTDEEIIDVYERSGLLSDWVNAVSKHMLDSALAGKQWEGYKLVEGRSIRKWKDEDQAITHLTKVAKWPLGDVVNTKIKGIGQIEKLVGKKDFELMDLTIKPQGKPTLAPEDDKRPAFGIEQAKKDFE